jgi:NAD(P)-dependent dehydrogenase (short-subunit alcohol dehydrogenase family)
VGLHAVIRRLGGRAGRIVADAAGVGAVPEKPGRLPYHAARAADEYFLSCTAQVLCDNVRNHSFNAAEIWLM